MPILNREPCLYPGALFDEDVQLDLQSEGAVWWVVYTMSRKEKEFMRRLSARHVPFYCPIVPKTYRSPQGRLRTSHLPLFPNYVFLCATQEQRLQALSTNCVSRCLDVTNPERLVADLRQIDRFLEADCGLTAEPALKPGTPVRVKSGPFQGVQGIVFERRNESRLLITVDFLQQGASLTIHDWELESC